MAGFDVCFRFNPSDRPVLDAMLSATRRRARVLRIRISTDVSQNYAYLEFDGQTFGLDIFLERLRRDLPTIAEATLASRSPASRRLLANGLIDIINRRRLGLYDRYERDERYSEWIPTLRGKSKPAYIFPHDIYPNRAIKLVDRMKVTMEMLASWHFGEVSPDVLIEEVHTAAELLMRSALGPDSVRMSFPQLISASHRRQILRTYTDFSDPLDLRVLKHGGVEALENHLRLRGRDTLSSLKFLRNKTKHAGGDGAKSWLDENFWNIASVLERLAGEARE